jgi:DNA repair protein Rad18
MKQWQVFGHLDKCRGPSQSGNVDVVRDIVSTPPFQFVRANGGHPSTRRHDGRPGRLAAVNYSLLKEQTLRKKLGELGLLSTGPKIILEKRHREWLTIWNANCDAAQPKTRSELLRDLDLWEKAQGARASLNIHAVEIRDKKFDTAAWADKHSPSFKDLISQAKRSGAGLNLHAMPPTTTLHHNAELMGTLAPLEIHECGSQAADDVKEDLEQGSTCAEGSAGHHLGNGDSDDNFSQVPDTMAN